MSPITNRNSVDPNEVSEDWLGPASDSYSTTGANGPALAREGHDGVGNIIQPPPSPPGDGRDRMYGEMAPRQKTFVLPDVQCARHFYTALPALS